MLSAIFRPAVLLMNRLSYPMKFGMVTALFAIPLVTTNLQLIFERDQEIVVVERKLEGIQLIEALHPIVVNSELLRDISVVNLYQNVDLAGDRFDSIHSELKEQIFIFSNKDLANSNNLLKLSAQSLSWKMDSIRETPRSDATTSRFIFEHVNRYVKSEYDLQAQIINDYGLTADEDNLSLQLVTLLAGEMQKYSELMGMGRAFGSFYLTESFIDSSGINLLDATLSQLDESAGRLGKHVEVLLKAYPRFKDSVYIKPLAVSSLNEQIRLLEETVVLDPDLATDWDNYFQSSTKQYDIFNEFKLGVIQHLKYQYLEQLRIKRNEKTFYISSMAALSIIFAYLFVGFYMSIRTSLRQLVSATMNVAEGDLDKEIVLDTRDELRSLAIVFDSMRNQLKVREQQLFDMAITDELTGLHNRKYFNDALSQSVSSANRTGTPITLLVLDIDHFKVINDTYGHPAGDHCLKIVADVFSDCLGRGADVVARFGGEEFVVLLSAADRKGGEYMAEMICHRIRNLPVTYKDHDVSVTVSIGLATSAGDRAVTEEELLIKADKALYEAKESGRDRWVYSK